MGVPSHQRRRHLCFHPAARRSTSTLSAPIRSLYDDVLAFYASIPGRLLEVLLGAALLYHALNGLRIVIIDLWPAMTVYHRQLWRATWIIFIVVGVPGRADHPASRVAAVPPAAGPRMTAEHGARVGNAQPPAASQCRSRPSAERARRPRGSRKELRRLVPDARHGRRAVRARAGALQHPALHLGPGRADRRVHRRRALELRSSGAASTGCC